jgi:AcrR family transcriptional regulator
MRPVEGLMERKKRRTRAQIAQTAMRMFLQRGFDQVSVTEIAEAAEVAEKTVYNHFPTKAHLVFDEDPDLLTGILDAVRNRATSQSALHALRAYLPARARQLGQHHPDVEHAAFRAMVFASPALREHQRAMAARYETALATALAQATGAEPNAPEPFIAAVALIGALRAGFDTAPAAGGADQAITRALDLLDTGLANYASTEQDVSRAEAPR